MPRPSPKLWIPILFALAPALACGTAPPRSAGGGVVEAPAAFSARPAPPREAHALPVNRVDAPGAFAFVIDAGQGYLVIDALSDEDVTLGAPRLLTDSKSGVHVIERALALGALQADVRLGGREFVLYEGAAPKCTVRAGALRALGVTYDPFDYPDGEFRGPDGPEPVTTAQRTTDYWNASNRYLAAPLRIPEGCGHPTWARLADLPSPRLVVVATTPTAAIQERATAYFRSTELHAQVQRDWLGVSGGAVDATPWDEAVPSTLSTWHIDDTTWVIQQAVWNEGCGQNGGQTVTYRLTPEGLAPVFEGDERYDVELLLDLDGDGQLEMLGRSEHGGLTLRRFWGSAGGSIASGDDIRRYAVPYHGCSC